MCGNDAMHAGLGRRNGDASVRVAAAVVVLSQELTVWTEQIKIGIERRALHVDLVGFASFHRVVNPLVVAIRRLVGQVGLDQESRMDYLLKQPDFEAHLRVWRY